MAAQVLGHVDQVSEAELKLPAFRGVQQGTVVGQEGLEYYYDRYLRGKPGVQRVEVNAEGYPVPARARRRPQPVAGHSLRADARPGPAEGGRKGAARRGSERARAGGKPAPRGRVRGDGPAQRADPRDRLLAELRPEQVRQTADPGTNTKRSIGHGATGGPLTDRAVNGAVPDRLDVQADHRDGRARRRRDHARRRPRRRPVHHRRRRAVLQRRPRRLRRGRARRSAEGLLGHLLLRSRRARQLATAT